MQNKSHITIERIYQNAYFRKGQPTLQSNAKKSSQDSPTLAFKEILKAEMAKLQ